MTAESREAFCTAAHVFFYGHDAVRSVAKLTKRPGVERVGPVGQEKKPARAWTGRADCVAWFGLLLGFRSRLSLGFEEVVQWRGQTIGPHPIFLSLPPKAVPGRLRRVSAARVVIGVARPCPPHGEGRSARPSSRLIVDAKAALSRPWARRGMRSGDRFTGGRRPGSGGRSRGRFRSPPR
jgi:hypothetical protein